ncbi:MAG: hypothetical protein ACE5HS_18295 [bacterium]
MNVAITIVVFAAILIVSFLVLRPLFKAYWRHKGKMMVTCPETEQPAGVEVDAKHAAFTATFGEKNLLLKECTRWPERQNCGQECLQQVEESPENCLVRVILTNWYQGKSCNYCGKVFEEIQWHDHKPALLSPDNEFVDWAKMPVEALPELLSTSQPVCWDCNLAETFRREHADLVTERPWKRGRLI